ncbi:MAG: DUF501 domain-containing protein [Halanaerobiaceae bacterium]|nr:DUF501 domain-containing protein [Halanaerobiaceae bacterium]
MVQIIVRKEEREIIKYQLGREAENIGGIALYCPFGKPAVLLTLPYSKEYGVFPTTYWLSCPYLVKEVSRLEEKGLIREFTEMLEKDDVLKERLLAAHQDYAVERMKLLEDEDRKQLADKKAILEVLSGSGIGGIRDMKGIKCLHTHLADYLARKKNPVGEVIWKKLSWPEDCHICDLDKVMKGGR